MTLILSGTDNSATVPAVQGGTAGTSTGLYYPTTSAVGISTAGTNAVYIDASQNVGIGTSAPSDVITLNKAGSSNVFQRITNGVNTSGMYVGLDTLGQANVYQAGNLPLLFFTNSIERARIDSSGNVGIGTNSPQSALQVSGAMPVSPTGNGVHVGITSSNTCMQFNAGSGNVSLIDFSTSGTDYLGRILYDNSGNSMQFSTNSTERMRISSTGIVTMSAYGVGTATFSAAGVISSVSDETWKIKDGVPVDTDSMLKKLEPGYWYYNDEKKEIFGVDRQLGFYAQNVNAAIGPEAAPTPEEGKPWGYYDRSVLAVTVMSLQKALATIESLTARITALEAA